MKCRPYYFYERGGTEAMQRFIDIKKPGFSFYTGDVFELTDEQIQIILPGFSKEDYEKWEAAPPEDEIL